MKSLWVQKEAEMEEQREAGPAGPAGPEVEVGEAESTEGVTRKWRDRDGPISLAVLHLSSGCDIFYSY